MTLYDIDIIETSTHLVTYRVSAKNRKAAERKALVGDTVEEFQHDQEYGVMNREIKNKARRVNR